MSYHVFSDVRLDDEVEKIARRLSKELQKELRDLERKMPMMKEHDRKALIKAIAGALPVEARKTINSIYL